MNTKQAGEQTQRTPGDWKAVGREVYNDKGVMVARAFNAQGEPENYAKLTVDAQFISAAPDLYNAVVAMVELDANPRPSPGANRIAYQHVDRLAKAALMKANQSGDRVATAAEEALIYLTEVAPSLESLGDMDDSDRVEIDVTVGWLREVRDALEGVLKL